MSRLRLFTKEEYAHIPAAQKGVRDGRRTVAFNGNTAVEGIDYLVEHDYTHLPVLHKNTARVGEFFTDGYACVQVLELTRLTDKEAWEQDLLYLDRVRTLRRWPGNTRNLTMCYALPGSDIRSKRC